ncbi:MAG TPA: ABC transporter permease [Pseudolabrys sp.]|nr:ABC transporter permease [Pseudolabrys sp.]
MTQSSPAQVNAAGEKTPPLPRAASQSASSAMPPDTRLAPPRLSRWRRPLQIAVGPILLFGLWYAAGALGLLNTRLIPTPGATLETTWLALTEGTMLYDLMRTLGRVLWAFALAAITGVPLGIIIGAYERVYRSIEFLIDFFRSMPATAMFPLFMLIFGLGDQGKIALAAFSAFLIIVFNVAYGVLNARKTRILAARSMGAGRARIFADVIFLETLPQTFVGLRAGVSLALVVIVVAEMFIGGMDGVGHRIMDDQMTYNLKDMYGALLLSGALGYCLNYAFLLIEKYFVHWAGR